MLRILKKIRNIPFAFMCWRNGIDRRKIGREGNPILINDGGHFIFTGGGKLYMVNDAKHSTLGVNRKCKLHVYKDAILRFDGLVMMSNTVIVATKEITFGHKVMIGGGVTIVDSDFHSLDCDNWFTPDDERLMKRSPVHIGNNVFIGMNSIILKGVTVGDGSIIAAGSVVSTSIPPGEIWGGNPARFVRKREE